MMKPASLLPVHLHDHRILVDDGRAGRAPLVVGVVEPAGVDRAQVALPEELPRHVVGVQALGGEVGDDEEQVDGVQLTTIEGNTNEGGSREGVGVFRRTARRISAINRGYLSYG